MESFVQREFLNFPEVQPTFSLIRPFLVPALSSPPPQPRLCPVLSSISFRILCSTLSSLVWVTFCENFVSRLFYLIQMFSYTASVCWKGYLWLFPLLLCQRLIDDIYLSLFSEFFILFHCCVCLFPCFQTIWLLELTNKSWSQVVSISLSFSSNAVFSLLGVSPPCEL